MQTTEPTDPEEFGPYIVYERLGVGGMATVHRAKQRGIAGFERDVALKRMLPDLAEDAECINSFVREVRLASLLVHPNIAQIYDFGRVGAVYYLAMEHVDGFDVRKMLRYSNRHKEPLSLNVVLSVLWELCDALEYAHTFVDERGQLQGVVHRDVSPSKLIVAHSGHLKVIDFGIATAKRRQRCAESGQIEGTLGYLSPEAVTGRAFLPVSDVFSAGVVAYELLTAHPLFSAKLDYDTSIRIGDAEIPPPSRRNPGVPAALDEVVLSALARDPERRLPTAGAFRTALERVAEQSGVRFSARDVVEWRAKIAAPEHPLAESHPEEEMALDGAREVRAPSSRLGGVSAAMNDVGGSERPSFDEGAAHRKRKRRPRSGEIVNNRFIIEHLAGTGGMGHVYRARDRRSGEPVALKVMRDAETLEIERFAREAHVTATLTHPGIVRYIDSGITAEGEPYLVMEWLSGQTLAARLQQTQLTLAESLALGRRVASALGAIHRRGVVHRDIKPSNLFLRGSAIDGVVLIDFGMARRPITDPKLTMTGTMLGTPGYMAPEQVCNAPNLDGRADIFSLGCVLYRCLSGRAPFHGPDALRMLLGGAPDQRPWLREIHPSIPPELDDLVARMLSRSPDDRPHNGDVVSAELLAIEETEPIPLSIRSGPRSVLSEIIVTERRLTCLVAARPLDRRAKGALPVMDRDGQDRALRAVVEHHRGKLEIFADGSLLAILSNADAATDLASRAARCALAIRALLDSGSAVVVCGRAILGPDLSGSELLDRSMDLLESTEKGAAVRIDELTSALLKNRFDTGSTGLDLCGELRASDRMRLPIGEPMMCVGREPELAQLEAIFDRCAEERTASMVLLTGAVGVGKSRVGHELLRRLRARGQAMEIWFAEADELNAESAFGLIAQVLRRASGLLDGEPGAARRDLLPSSEQMGQVFLSLLRAACAAQPVVLVLEDLHWGDLPTIKLIDAALGALSDQPLMVLALARTEVHEIFPQLRADRRVQEIRIRKLSRRASEQLVRQVLGDAVGGEAVNALVERSEGHAAYLEEMIGAVAEGKGTMTPATVLAMVQARIEKLDPEARRVLQAASIFGETFWRGGVEALLGGGDTAAWLAELVEQDVIAIKDDGRFPAEVELCFRHALVREAAYGMLTEGDMVAGHWLAGQWLEQAGETDTAILEEHFECCGRGGQPGTRP